MQPGLALPAVVLVAGNLSPALLQQNSRAQRALLLQASAAVESALLAALTLGLVGSTLPLRLPGAFPPLARPPAGPRVPLVAFGLGRAGADGNSWVRSGRTYG